MFAFYRNDAGRTPTGYTRAPAKCPANYLTRPKPIRLTSTRCGSVGRVVNANLDTLREEIVQHVTSRGLVVFESDLRSVETEQAVYWNLDREPDYKRFVAAAEAAGARLVTIFSRDLNGDLLQSLLEKIEDLPLEPTERRSLERRLRDLRAYEGFTGHIELSFDVAGRDYIFDLRAEWYDEIEELMDEMAAAVDELEEDEPEDDASDEPMAPYFSRN
jgi:hypothetical protein